MPSVRPAQVMWPKPRSTISTVLQFCPVLHDPRDPPTVFPSEGLCCDTIQARTDVERQHRGPSDIPTTQTQQSASLGRPPSSPGWRRAQKPGGRGGSLGAGIWVGRCYMRWARSWVPRVLTSWRERRQVWRGHWYLEPLLWGLSQVVRV